MSFQEELWKNNTKTFQTNVFKGQTDNAFVFLCKGLWQLLCSSLFCLWILSALTFYCSSYCGFFVGACFICSFRVFGGLLLKMVNALCSLFLLKDRFLRERFLNFYEYLHLKCLFMWWFNFRLSLFTGKTFACSLMSCNKDSHSE